MERQGRREGDEIRFQCPYPEKHAHGDKTPSASYNPAKGVWFCHRCGEKGDWRDLSPLLSIELPPAERAGRRKLVATYLYRDATGTPLYQVLRYEPKSFRQRRPDGAGGWISNLKGVKRVLYQLPEVTAAIQKGETVYLVEGERDADNLAQLGIP